jgi:large subunit ribosomal protein L24
MTQPRFKVKKGDLVEVMCGSDKGKQGRVEKVFLDEGRVQVSGIRKVTRHIRPSMQHPEGVFSKELSVHISNVAVVDPSTAHPSRVGVRVTEGGDRVRYFKKSGAEVERPVR